jgi:hypothetical protein
MNSFESPLEEVIEIQPVESEQMPSTESVPELERDIRTSFETLNSSWQQLQERDTSYLRDADREVLNRAWSGEDAASREVSQELHVGFGRMIRSTTEEVRKLDSSDVVTGLSPERIRGFSEGLLDKVVNSTNPEEVSLCAQEILSGVYGIGEELLPNRDDVDRLYRGIIIRSNELFGYDSQGTTERLEGLLEQKTTQDAKSLNDIREALSSVRLKVTDLATQRLSLLSKPVQQNEQV